MPCGSRHTIMGLRAPGRPRSATRQGGRDPTTTRTSRMEGLLPGTSSAGVAGARITAAALPSGWCLWRRFVRRTAGAAWSIVALAVTSVCASADCDCLTTSCMQTIRFLLPAVSQCRRTKCPGAIVRQGRLEILTRCSLRIHCRACLEILCQFFLPSLENKMIERFEILIGYVLYKKLRVV